MPPFFLDIVEVVVGKPGTPMWRFVTGLVGWTSALALGAWLLASIVGFQKAAPFLFGFGMFLLPIAMELSYRDMQHQRAPQIDWQPMSSAPKNRPILLYCASGGDRYVIANWDNGDREWRTNAPNNLSADLPIYWAELTSPGRPRHRGGN